MSFKEGRSEQGLLFLFAKITWCIMNQYLPLFHSIIDLIGFDFRV